MTNILLVKWKALNFYSHHLKMINRNDIEKKIKIKMFTIVLNFFCLQGEQFYDGP